MLYVIDYLKWLCKTKYKGEDDMSVDAYLNFNGNCREAVLYYADVFQLPTPELMTFGEMPGGPKEANLSEVKNLILHARLQISGSNVMFSDVFPGSPFIEGNNIALAFVTSDKEEIIQAFAKLRDGGKVQMELQETFWSKHYGMLTDRFGIQWLFSLEQ